MCSSCNCGSLFTFPPISRQEQPLRIKKGDTLSPRVIRGSFQPARRSKALPYTSIERVGRKGLSLLPVECEIRQGNIRSANGEQGHPRTLQLVGAGTFLLSRKLSLQMCEPRTRVMSCNPRKRSASPALVVNLPHHGLCPLNSCDKPKRSSVVLRRRATKIHGRVT